MQNVPKNVNPIVLLNIVVIKELIYAYILYVSFKFRLVTLFCAILFITIEASIQIDININELINIAPAIYFIIFIKKYNF